MQILCLRPLSCFAVVSCDSRRCVNKSVVALERPSEHWAKRLHMLEITGQMGPAVPSGAVAYAPAATAAPGISAGAIQDYTQALRGMPRFRPYHIIFVGRARRLGLPRRARS